MTWWSHIRFDFFINNSFATSEIRFLSDKWRKKIVFYFTLFFSPSFFQQQWISHKWQIDFPSESRNKFVDKFLKAICPTFDFPRLSHPPSLKALKAGEEGTRCLIDFNWIGKRKAAATGVRTNQDGDRKYNGFNPFNFIRPDVHFAWEFRIFHGQRWNHRTSTERVTANKIAAEIFCPESRVACSG